MLCQLGGDMTIQNVNVTKEYFLQWFTIEHEIGVRFIFVSTHILSGLSFYAKNHEYEMSKKDLPSLGLLRISKHLHCIEPHMI